MCKTTLKASFHHGMTINSARCGIDLSVRPNMTKHDVKFIIANERGNDGMQSSLLQIIFSRLCFVIKGRLSVDCERRKSFVHLRNLIWIPFRALSGIFNIARKFIKTLLSEVERRQLEAFRKRRIMRGERFF